MFLDKDTTLALLRDQYGRVAAAHSARWGALSLIQRMTGVTQDQPASYLPHRIVYAREDGGVSIVCPTIEMMHYLMTGGIIRDMRQVDIWDERGAPKMEGTGALLAPMTYQQAINYLAWRDVPAGILAVKIIPTSEIPVDRSYRNAWRLKGGNYYVEQSAA